MIVLDKVSKVFGSGNAGLSEVTFSITGGEFVFFVGPSGAGKTTLFRLLIRDMLPTHGTVIIANWDISKLPTSKIPTLRKKIGVVFQDLKLLPNRTILENVSLPLDFSGYSTEDAHQKAEEVLERVGLLSHKEKFPIQLSGGELQRVAIARALVLSPEILLADEPTGNLDTHTALGIVDLLSEINKTGTTILMATHNTDIINKLKKRVIMLEKGKIIRDDKAKEVVKEVAKEQPKETQKEPPKEASKEHTSHSSTQKEEKEKAKSN
jgi:cell division transport system ATP-binding protein